MRITGGILKGREIKVPKGSVRPTQDKVRAAIFSSLAAQVPGSRVLDLFAGSGALGLEALSRDAAFVCWVERDRRVWATLNENVHHLCGPESGRTRCVLSEVERFLKSGWEGEPFDIVLADPPYQRDGTAPWVGNLLSALEERPILTPNGVLVFEQNARTPVIEKDGWVLVKNRHYGDTRVLCYVRKMEAGGKS